MQHSYKARTYPYKFIFLNKLCFLLWQGSEKDGGDRFVTTGNELLIENDLESCRQFAEQQNINVLWDEPALMNFDCFWDVTTTLVDQKKLFPEDCKTFLDGWNCLEDMAKSASENLLTLSTPEMNLTYEKIFKGSHILELDQKNYHPIWSAEEAQAIKVAFKCAWNQLSPFTKDWGARV